MNNAHVAFGDMHHAEKNTKGGELFRRPYCKPQLTSLGDLRSLTLGPSPSGYEDSAGGGYSESFPTLPPPTP